MENTETRPLKTVSFSLTENTHVLKYEDINGNGRLFGGRLFGWIDECGGFAAMRHSEHNVATACVDNLVFKRGCQLNDMVVNIGRVTWVGHTSMEVRVDSYLEDKQGMRIPINRAYLIYVAVNDATQRPVPVPFGLEIRTENEMAEWEGALRRREVRLKRRKEGY